MRALLALNTQQLLPWTVLTFPFVNDGNGQGLLFFAIGMMWWYWVGQGLESLTGRWGLLLWFLAFSFVTGLLAFLGTLFGLGATVLIGPFLTISCMTVIFCGRAPEQEIRFWGIIPLKLKWLALITGLMVIFGYGTGTPLFGLLLALPLVLAWFLGLGKLPISLATANVEKRKSKKVENREFDVYMSKVKAKEQEREEKERLRKLFENSMRDE